MDKYVAIFRERNDIKVEVYSSEEKRLTGGKGDLESHEGWKDENGKIHIGVKGEGFIST